MTHHRDESFNSQSHKDQKSLRAINREHPHNNRPDDTGAVGQIMTNFNREKDQFNAKLMDLK